jgi:hypothetical protein
MSKNDPATKPEFLTGTQQTVVECRLRDGYEMQRQPNGNFRMWKGCHTMEINCLGYDCYVSPSNIDRAITEYYTGRANSGLASRAQ